MNLLSWEISILSRAVHFPNLSAASRRIGLSQPQLSRIVQKVEADLGLVLLDRSVRRHSTWTTQAIQLGEASRKLFRSFEGEIQQLAKPTTRRNLHIGTLEGLADIATQMTQQCFDRGGIERIELDIYDLHGLEERFLMGRLDLILTARDMTSASRGAYVQVLGYQKMRRMETSTRYELFSSFEFHNALEQGHGRRRKPKERRSEGDYLKSLENRKTKVLISNSLSLRLLWLNRYGAKGNFPEPTLAPTPAADRSAVTLIGQPSLGDQLWEVIRTTKIENRDRKDPT